MKNEKRVTLINHHNDNSSDAIRKTYFHLRLSIQYVKFLKNGMAIEFVQTKIRNINSPQIAEINADYFYAFIVVFLFASNEK